MCQIREVSLYYTNHTCVCTYVRTVGMREGKYYNNIHTYVRMYVCAYVRVCVWSTV